ncbi:hypothetical protein JYT97_01510 [Haliea sp. AH-315-K21]|uniref:TerB family tellurite resistance protein n=1 Tax=SAR86 cluster bacterium TaxID=2030880 RepID=A0A2A5CCC6_9GAMM|nr:hypothetical protein [Haliea sp. AH-315-K21]PCJ41171.1 MAG: hypothetical protein COA71_08990 [SAR86 cluster bacterium]
MNFNDFIELLVVASVAIGFLTTYLMLNKIWSRKSDENVANSVSVFASLLGIASTLPFLIKYGLLDGEYKGAAKAVVSIFSSALFLLIGSGYWVRNKSKRESLWSKFKKAIKLEGHEAGDLVKALLLPAGADKMLIILRQLALIDNRIDEREFEFIDTFAKFWNIPFDRDSLEGELAASSVESGYIELRFSVADYLNIEPPVEQSSHLRDVLNALAASDKEVSDEESFILKEINSMLDAYASNELSQDQFEVAIAPQDSDQEDLLKKLLPELIASEINGGKGYVVGTYFSYDFAQMVSKKYRSLNLFTAIDTLHAESAE